MTVPGIRRLGSWEHGVFKGHWNTRAVQVQDPARMQQGTRGQVRNNSNCATAVFLLQILKYQSRVWTHLKTIRRSLDVLDTLYVFFLFVHFLCQNRDSGILSTNISSPKMAVWSIHKVRIWISEFDSSRFWNVEGSNSQAHNARRDFKISQKFRLRDS